MWYLLFPPRVLGDDRGGANGEGPTLHVGQEALLHQVRPLEPHVAIHLQQLVDLCGGRWEHEGSLWDKQDTIIRTLFEEL